MTTSGSCISRSRTISARRRCQTARVPSNRRRRCSGSSGTRCVSVVEQGGLSFDSYLDFNADICSRIHRLVAGPPALRTRQMLALMDAGVVRMPYGPAPARGLAVNEMDPAATRTRISSTAFEAPYAGRCRRPDPWAPRGAADRRLGVAAAHPALQPRPGEPVPLRRGGRRQRRPDGRLSPDRRRRPASREHLDVRRADRGRAPLHAYIPSPRSRIRAFEDVGACVAEILADSCVSGNVWSHSRWRRAR